MENTQFVKGPRKQAIQVQKKSIEIEIETVPQEKFELQKQPPQSQVQVQPNDSYTNCQQPQSPRLSQPPVQVFKRIKIRKLEILCELVILGLLIYTWIFFIQEYFKIDQRVPVQFDIDASVDTVDKDNFFLLIAIDTFTYLLTSILQMLPHKFKYLVEVTEQNCEKIFLLTRVFIMYIKFVTIGIFLYATIALFYIVEQKWHPLMMYFSSFLVLFYFIGSYTYYKLLIRISINPFA